MTADRLRVAAARRPAITLVVVTLAAVVALAVDVYVQQRADLRDQALGHLESTAEIQRGRIAGLADEAREEHALVASRTGLRDLLAAYAVEPTTRLETEIHGILRDAAAADPDILALQVYAPGTERAVANTDATVELPSVHAPPGDEPTIGFVLAPDGTLREVVTGPIPLDGTDAGTLVAVRDPAGLLATLVDRTGLGETGETLLAYRDETGQARFVAPRRFDPEALEAVPGVEDTPLPIDRALGGQDGVVTDLVDYRGIPVFAATRHVPSTGWGLVTKIDRDEALAPVRELRDTLVIGTLVVLAAVGGAGLVISGALRSSRRALRVSRARLEQVLGTAPVGIVFVDGAGTITYANDRAEELLGLTRSQVAERTYDDPRWVVTDLDDQPMPTEDFPVARVLATGTEVRDVRQVIRSGDGRRRVLSVDAAPLRDPDGELTGVIAAFDDITTAVVANRARAHLASIVASADDAVIGLEIDGRIASWNPSAERLFGYDADEIIGENVTRLVPPELRGELERMHEDVRAGGNVTGLETERLRRDGSRFPVSLTLSPIRDDAGVVVGMSAIDRDITGQVRERRQLEHYAAELEQFAHVVAHDLQEPLRMVASFPELLARRYEGRLGDDADEFIGFAVEGARRIRGKLNDLLAYVSVSAETARGPVDTGRLARATLTSLRAELHQADGEVVVGTLPTVLGDETQLMRVFRNLIGNAVKFHSDRPVRIHVDARRTNGSWEFTVRDNGIGIAEEHLDRLFLLFRRLHTQLEYPGSGLGLAICKKIVERHGGEIWIESEVDVGTTVRFTLPAVDMPGGAPESDPTTSEEFTHA